MPFRLRYSAPRLSPSPCGFSLPLPHCGIKSLSSSRPRASRGQGPCSAQGLAYKSPEWKCRGQSSHEDGHGLQGTGQELFVSPPPPSAQDKLWEVRWGRAGGEGLCWSPRGDCTSCGALVSAPPATCLDGVPQTLDTNAAGTSLCIYFWLTQPDALFPSLFGSCAPGKQLR